MDEVLLPAIFGILITILGFSNMKGNISSLHWYHKKRVTEEDRLPFGRMVGLGTIICGVSVTLSGCLTFAAEQTQNALFTTISNGIVAVGLIIGISITLYAIMKYNKGLF